VEDWNASDQLKRSPSGGPGRSGGGACCTGMFSKSALSKVEQEKDQIIRHEKRKNRNIRVKNSQQGFAFLAAWCKVSEKNL
jgi:hypothetical protein